ncbi:hypothetical protein KC644_03295, partial [Candidatus Berkelbacteria bacterium]|nr:hypothetical protein [Candidatus Berkelbacteria bacterium]
MSNSRAENFFGLLATTLRFGLTVLTALILTLQANGYIIDFKNFTLEKSSLIAIKFDDLPDLVQVDNQPLVVERNQVIEQINPGQHDLIFSKEGYYDWYNSFRVEPGQAEHYEDVKLFLQEPILVNRQSVTAPPLPQASPDILVLGSELWLRLPDQLKLIT